MATTKMAIRLPARGHPQRVNVHDFADKELGKAVPYGVYDVAANTGFVSVGITSDTAAYPVEATAPGSDAWGATVSKCARTNDYGGLWRFKWCACAALEGRIAGSPKTGLVLHVLHYPPGTSKWNKIEHRMFCHITENWRGRPLTDRLAIVELIGATTTKTGLRSSAPSIHEPTKRASTSAMLRWRC